MGLGETRTANHLGSNSTNKAIETVQKSPANPRIQPQQGVKYSSKTNTCLIL